MPPWPKETFNYYTCVCTVYVSSRNGRKNGRLIQCISKRHLINHQRIDFRLFAAINARFSKCQTCFDTLHAPSFYWLVLFEVLYFQNAVSLFFLCFARCCNQSFLRKRYAYFVFFYLKIIRSTDTLLFFVLRWRPDLAKLTFF